MPLLGRGLPLGQQCIGGISGVDMNLITPSLKQKLPTATKAQGNYIFDKSGRRWFDASSGPIASSVGHCHPKVVEAITKTIGEIDFVYRGQFSNVAAERLASRLCSQFGYSAAFFVNSGSEAIETAVRFAQQYWRERRKPTKTRILSRRLSYHGATIGALGLSGHWPRRRSAGPLFNVPTLSTPYPLRSAGTREANEYVNHSLLEIETEIFNTGADEIAAILVEPIVGASGAVIVPPDGYLQGVRELCYRHDILLIADEVLTGLGRTGAWLSAEHWATRADIVCLGKGLNAGYFPISCVLINEEIIDAIRVGSSAVTLGHTHSNHPLGAAIANSVLDILESENLIDNSRKLGRLLKESLYSELRDCPIVGEIRGKGLLIGIELVHERASLCPFRPEVRAAEIVVGTAFQEGLIVYPSSGFAGALGGDAIMIAPPLNICAADVEEITRLTAKSFKKAVELLLPGKESCV